MVDMIWDILKQCLITHICWVSTAFENTRDSNFYAGLNIGTQHFFGDYFGLRWFIGAGYIGSFKTAELNLGVDAILNFFNNNNFSFGIFAGVGSGFQLLVRPVSKGEIPIIGRVGLSFGIGEHNRIDITTQIPIITGVSKHLTRHLAKSMLQSAFL